MPKGHYTRVKAADEAQEPVSKPRGQDALVTVTVETADGTSTHTFRVAGFVGNTLPWQRSGKGLEGMLIPGMQRAFGGQVTLEE